MRFPEIVSELFIPPFYELSRLNDGAPERLSLPCCPALIPLQARWQGRDQDRWEEDRRQDNRGEVAVPCCFRL